jgi:hypothetical protein
VRQLTAEHHVDEPLYRDAEAAFTREGIVAMTILAGCYQVVCSLLNAFEIPAPAHEASSKAEQSETDRESRRRENVSRAHP